MLQEAIEAHGLHRLQPVATAIVAQEERTYCNGPRPRPLSRKTARLWQRVRERTSYSPRLQALPAPFVETSTEAVQHSYLALHAEKKALTDLLLQCSTPDMLQTADGLPDIRINFHMCEDCHAFFKEASQLLHRRLVVLEPKLRHVFSEGTCSCRDQWRFEARAAGVGQE